MNLWEQIEIKASVITLNPTGASDFKHLDQNGFPVQVCHFKRAASSKVFKDIAGYGFSASKEETCHEFKGNLMISSEGGIPHHNQLV